MTMEQNIKAILECFFTGFKDEIIESATKRIMEQISIVPCDAVSREAILSKIKEVCFSKKWVQFRIDNGSNGQRDFLINYIEHLPSVNPQESKTDVLGKIRAEIDEYRNSWMPTGNSIDNAGWSACNKCIEIIDKHREPQAESEERRSGEE